MMTTLPSLPCPGPRAPRRRWAVPLLAGIAVLWLLLALHALGSGVAQEAPQSAWAWLGTALLHGPYLLILALLGFGLTERIGFLLRPEGHRPGRLPATLPTVCVQLPMFNEDAVAARVIGAAAALDWPAERLLIQVLDDSTDATTRAHVRAVCERLGREHGVRVEWLHRSDRTGYKAGALEAGRHRTDAEFIAIFDADFVPPRDYLRRALPLFFDSRARPHADVGLVQAQWGHLNDDESALTEAQALWVDDHHSLQMSWRTRHLGFVNFTGTAGVWRAAAIESAGGWRSTSLVEDCELSIRVLFAGWRTRFVRELAVPAELPQTLAAYRLQQKRWTQGWAQLQRLHLLPMLTRYRTGAARKAFLTYLMCISWQWPLWATWILTLPILIAHGLWVGAGSSLAAVAVYLLPALGFSVLAAAAATLHTRHGQGSTGGYWRRFARIGPYLVVHTGMLPHHVCAFIEGLLGPMHAEFERTPKTASVTAPMPLDAADATARRTAAAAERASQAPPRAAVHRPAPWRLRRPSRRTAYSAFEAAFVTVQLVWVAFFVMQQLPLAALGAAWLAGCVIALRLAPLWVQLQRRLRPAEALS
jgi:cellulose synthase/poly-beta-1,6-N-acetylglucosamine synthase-like glycosyltransferase